MRCCKKLKSGDTLCQLQSTEDEEEEEDVDEFGGNTRVAGFDVVYSIWL